MPSLLRFVLGVLLCVVVLLYCYVVMLLCCYVVMLLCCYVVLLLCCCVVLLLYCYIVILLYCYIVILLYCYIVILLYCYIVYCYIVTIVMGCYYGKNFWFLLIIFGEKKQSSFSLLFFWLLTIINICYFCSLIVYLTYLCLLQSVSTNDFDAFDEKGNLKK